jgi:hypothetical protein
VETETKTLALALKADAPEGSFVATFATLGVVDAHRDVTMPGAFEDGKAVLVGPYQHDWLGLPTGKGVIRVDDDQARVDGEFFLDTEHGKATYLTVKNAGELMEWSYVFTVTKASEGDFDGPDGTVIPDVRFLEGLDVWSVDPVLKGAGVGTGTDHIKGLAPAAAYADHAGSLTVEVATFISRTNARIDQRAADGRSLSTDDRDRLTALLKGLADAGARLEDVLHEGKADESIDIQRELLRYQRTVALEAGALAVSA